MSVSDEDLPNKVIRLGLACNEKCLFCNVPPDCHEISGEEYARESILKSKKGSCVSLSGGEPVLYSFLPDIIKTAVARGVGTELQTNAVLLSDPAKVRILAEAGLNQAFVSLHSHIARVHDFLTGLEGSWEKGVAGIKNLRDAGIYVSINTVLTSVNYSGIPDFIVFIARRLGIRLLSLSVVQPRKRAFKNKALVPDYSKLDKPVRLAIKVAEQEGLRLINPICGLPLCIGGWETCPEQCMEYVQAKFGQPFTAGKIKPDCCRQCAASGFCGGIWDEYNLLRGSSALRPFKTFPAEK
ncbi:MAG: radical SAM protein [Elusimicrobiales bacterium]|nr:radical SAM protein [Elusimicrobiales bacterium]